MEIKYFFEPKFLTFILRVDHDFILKTYAEKTGLKVEYELEPVEEQSRRLAARRSNNVLSTEKLEQWLALVSPDTRKLYYTPHTVPELKKSIESICANRAATLRTKSVDEESKKRKLLVTGGCGFIGSNFVNYWLETYPNDYVVNVDRLDACSNTKNIENPDSPNYKLVVASINNKDLMLHLMKQYEITHVVHFAGSSSFVFRKTDFCFSFTPFKLKPTSTRRSGTAFFSRSRTFLEHIAFWKQVEFTTNSRSLFTSAPTKFTANGQQVVLLSMKK